MNQTKKRLSIIKLAISITDLETIQLQILKLTPIKTDEKIQEILTLLQSGSYAQAQALITDYIENAPDEILQRSSQEQKTQPSISDEDQAIIDEFNLFVTPASPETKTVEIDINDYVTEEPNIKKDNETKTIDYDSLLNLDADDVLKDNIDIDLSRTPETKPQQDSFFDTSGDSLGKSLYDSNDDPIQKDTFFDVITDEIEKQDKKEVVKEELNSTDEVKKEKELFNVTQIEDEETDELFDTPHEEKKPKVKIMKYDPMPHILQKYITMKKRYPLIQKTYARFDTVDTLLNKISQDGYTEAEIEEMLTYIKKLMEKSKYTEAAQLLLVCASTESRFAQFMLARELFIGSVLQKNIPESFTLMNTLALEDYPEALCDLGQFYENGIGTSPDLLKAESLYREATSLGIKRAKKHYTRLKKQNRGFFKA
jgi:hypothetical protein